MTAPRAVLPPGWAGSPTEPPEAHTGAPGAFYRASMRVVGLGEAVEVRCAGPEAVKLAVGIEATLRAAGPRRSGRLAASVRRKGAVVVIGGPHAPHARFQQRAIGELAHAVLRGGPTEPVDEPPVGRPGRARRPRATTTAALQRAVEELTARVAKLEAAMSRLYPEDFGADR